MAFFSIRKMDLLSDGHLGPLWGRQVSERRYSALRTACGDSTNWWKEVDEAGLGPNWITSRRDPRAETVGRCRWRDVWIAARTRRAYDEWIVGMGCDCEGERQKLLAWGWWGQDFMETRSLINISELTIVSVERVGSSSPDAIICAAFLFALKYGRR